eukprot:CAMPEP_0116008570 /NCGR_PEP_ID=MMETSP0321-20121206/2933_1 /TAXON_ID=163516 /ORGANISM="Leptocylindrus danicus var. danicus, Strain B650" /LENGTH=259 /DNA_ID=CAMNT_0003477401 /DNA_START=609 /DNA_END=1388 /DNA_ORIENTATION=-
MLLASMILERIFEETLGWKAADRLSLVSVDIFNIDNTNDDDKYQLDFARTEHGDVKGNGIARKVRPYSISNSEKNETSSNLMLYSPPRPKRVQKSSLASKPRIQDRLASAFFHQHQDLQKIADFVAETVVRNFSREIDLYIVSAVNEKLLSLEETSIPFIDPSSASFDLSKWSQLIGVVQENACSGAISSLEERCKKDVETSMAVLVPMPESDKLVKDVAIKMTIQHAIRKGTTQIESFVKVESKRCFDEALQKKKSEL